MAITDKIIAELAFLKEGDTDDLARVQGATEDAFLLMAQHLNEDAEADPDNLSAPKKMLIRYRACLLLIEQEAVAAATGTGETPAGIYVKKTKIDVVEKEFAMAKSGESVSFEQLADTYRTKICEAASGFGIELPECSATSGSISEDEIVIVPTMFFPQ